MARPPRFEGSAEDNRADAKGAKKMGISKKAFESTAADKAKDKAGQQKFNARFKKGK